MTMACLKYLAQCPCPRCLLLKSKISLIGTKCDAQARVKLVCIDDDRQRWDVELVRKWIFENGISLTSVAVDQILGPKSLTPTCVCLALFPKLDLDYIFYIECFL